MTANASFKVTYLGGPTAIRNLDAAVASPNATIIPLHSDGWTRYTQHEKDLSKAYGMVGIGQRLQILEPGKVTVLGGVMV